jgi:hypothetical protein
MITWLAEDIEGLLSAEEIQEIFISGPNNAVSLIDFISQKFSIF